MFVKINRVLKSEDFAERGMNAMGFGDVAKSLVGVIGFGAFYSKYVDSNKANFSALGYAGKSSEYAAGYKIYGVSYYWATSAIWEKVF